ncbi:MAG: peptide ABC transporter substrate-binding protein, partial [Pseudomonadota bacterium]|nr:peptide ABC transporter substrate-binding protein [Pseudomonadota bacterium]
MKEHQLRALIEDVRNGELPRRSFIQQMVGLGLTAPMASMMLMHAGIAQAQANPVYKPTKRGGGGPLRTLWWQGPTLLQPHFANGTKDQEGSRVFYEPLAVWDNDGNLVPILAAEIPSRDNGGLAADGKSVTWKLKKGVTWHDGQPFTADDCVFTSEFVKDPASACVTIAVWKDLTVEKVDDHTVRVLYPKPTPFWATAFCAAEGMVIPKHLFGPYSGAKSRDAPTNLKPVGTGPYKFVDFKPGDIVRGTINTNYHMPNRPYFDTIEMKGGGDATSAARAVLQTGEYDYAWNLQVEDEVLLGMEKGGKGKVHIVPGGDIEFIQLNITDPWNEVDGERGSVKSHHFAFSDPKVREAMSLLCDKKSMQTFIYGRTGFATANFMNNPPRFRSPNTKWEFNIDKANALLDAAGWKKGGDGIREKGGKKMHFVYQTSINGTRQKEQAIVKQACQKAGIDLELKSVTASVFFSSDVGNPDTYPKFWA